MFTNFSQRHKLQRFVRLENGLHRLIILHFTENWVFDSFKDQIYLLISVAHFCLGFLKELVWFAYRVLNVPSVRPTYVSSFLLSAAVMTVAW